MELFKYGAIIAVVAIIAGVIKEVLSKKAVPEVDLSSIEQRLDQLESLKARIETLETIVTDKGYDLKQEINNLR